MKQKLIIFVLLVHTMLLGGCDRTESGTSNSFVMAYQNMNQENFRIAQLDSMAIVMYPADVTTIATWKSKYKDKKKYQALSEKYGDISFNKYISVYEGSYINPIIDIDIVSIKVVSDQDYDANHPAGADLSDIMNYIGASPYYYIQNNYKERTTAPATARGKLYLDKITAGRNRLCSMPEEEVNKGYYMIEKRVSELTVDDLKMIGIRSSVSYKNGGSYSFGILEFAHLPTLEKRHAIRVTLNLLDGTKVEDLIRITLE